MNHGEQPDIHNLGFTLMQETHFTLFSMCTKSHQKDKASKGKTFPPKTLYYTTKLQNPALPRSILSTIRGAFVPIKLSQSF